MSRSGPPSPAPSTRPPAGSSAREREKELADYVRAGQLDRAAMVARSLGDPRSAAALFVGAGMHYQAAVCFYEAGSKEEALEAFLRIPLDDARYRRACAHAIRIGCELGSLTRALDAFVARYVAAPPEGDADLASLYQLGVLYQKSELFDHAREAFARVRSVDAAYADVAQRMSVIEPVLRNEAVYRDILRQDAASWRRPSSLAPARADDDAARQPTAADPSASLAELSARPSPSVREGPRSPGPDLAPGAIVAHRYRVEQQIGRGGMGVVYRATDLELEEAVAIKVFGHRLDEPDLVQRFKQELSICRSLAHPNIVRLHDIGAHEGRKFLSMELLAGAALDAILKRPVELRPAIQILQQACAGVGAAHRGGVVHRDVKPDNLFVTTEGIVKLMDFGLAKRLASLDEGASSQVTQAGFLGGSPAYMAPEQITDFGQTGFSADIYSLGVVAYELFAGRRPFRHKERARLLHMQLTEQPAPPSEVKPDLPASIDGLVLRCLEKDPAARFGSCEELHDALLALDEGLR